jgi:hypothetical protein
MVSGKSKIKFYFGTLDTPIEPSGFWSGMGQKKLNFFFVT